MHISTYYEDILIVNFFPLTHTKHQQQKLVLKYTHVFKQDVFNYNLFLNTQIYRKNSYVLKNIHRT